MATVKALSPPAPASARPCFHCGLSGHKTASCPSSADPQSEAGLAAFQCFLDTRRKFAALREEEKNVGGGSANAAGNDERSARGPLHHLERVVEWMQKEHANDDNTGVVVPRDPIAVLRSFAAPSSSPQSEMAQRSQDLYNARVKNLHHSYRELFRHHMSKVRRLLVQELDMSDFDDTKQCKSGWSAELSRAVQMGRPANFSARERGNDDGIDYDGDCSSAEGEAGNGGGNEGRNKGGQPCLKMYAVEKLTARCRQLHHLLLHENPYSEKVRTLLLPTVAINDGEPSSSPAPVRPVSVVSLGGGPGYDHVALCLVARYLHRVQPSRGEQQARQISTRLFDLYDDDWAPILVTLGECCHKALLSDEDEMREQDGVDSSSSSSRSDMAVSHADLRLPLNDPIHADLYRTIAEADIIVVQFVLHENASYLLLTQEDASEHGRDRIGGGEERIGGAMGDILRIAPFGTIVVCTDSSNALWPALRNTAVAWGWRCMSDDDIERQIVMGPKSFVLLERVLEA